MKVPVDEIVKALEYLYAKRDLIERIKQHGIAPPDGYVLVPVEPTEAMWEEGSYMFSNDGDTRQVYQAMLAAAPKENSNDG